MDFRLYGLSTLFPFLFFSLIVALIVAPLFAPGYVFFLDMVWGPGMTLDDSLRNGIGSGLPLFAFHRFLALIIPNDILQKLILFGILLLPGLSMYHLAKRFLPASYAIGSGLFFFMNPFVHDRFLAGQWIVLLGYGFLPIVVGAFLSFLERSDGKRWLIFSFLFALFPFISIHFAALSAPIIATIGLVHIAKHSLWRTLVSRVSFFRAIPFCALFLSLHSFWLFGFFAPEKPFAVFGISDFETFRTTARATGTVWGDAFALSGFWDDDFMTTRDLIPGWRFVSILVIFFSTIGAIVLAGEKRTLAIALSILLLPTLFLAIGFGSVLTKPATEWSFEHLPLFRGFRDTAKFLGILAFAYALFLPAGIRAVWIRLAHRFPSLPENARAVPLAVLFVTPLFLSGTILFGSAGQIDSHRYPKDWYRAEAILRKNSEATALFLPWKGYLVLDFADDAFVANPGNAFFTTPLITSRNTGNRKLSASGKSEWDTFVLDLLKDSATRERAIREMKKRGVSHLILAKTDAWRPYRTLNSSQSLKSLLDTNTLTLWEIR